MIPFDFKSSSRSSLLSVRSVSKIFSPVWFVLKDDFWLLLFLVFTAVPCLVSNAYFVYFVPVCYESVEAFSVQSRVLHYFTARLSE